MPSQTFMNSDSKIYVAGHNGMTGSAIVRNLRAKHYTNLILKNRQELDLTRQADVEQFFSIEKPEYVFLAAAKVGGILANHTYPAEFIFQNLSIETHILHSAYRHGVKRLLFLGSSCIYPKECSQPMKEQHLLSGYLEPTNEPYAIAKIAGIKMCEAYNRQYGTQFLSAMPTNLYGEGDNFDLQTSHVLPALVRKFHEGREQNTSVTIWGTGRPQRELLYIDDCAEACVFLMNQPVELYSQLLNHEAGPVINIGTGEGLTISELVEKIMQIVGFKGQVEWDTTKPDGTMKKVLDVTRLKELGWRPHVSLKDGIQKTYNWYQQHHHGIQARETRTASIC
ncbi:MAG: GDP-L-fucose synthase [Nitrospirales bacterium]|nr:MAG: GDP-L-fucose synthase [Nitrospirales bacterium]